MKHVLLSFAVLLAGCGSGRVKTIAGLVSPSMRLEFAGSHASLVVTDGDSGACPSVEATGTMNGVRLVQVERGGESSFIDIGKGGLPGVSDACLSPAWNVPYPIPDTSVVQFDISDDTGRLSYGASALGAERTLSWVSPASGAVRWGDLVSLQWSPATDDAEGDLRLVSGDRAIQLQVQLTPEYSYQDGRVTFRLPPAPPDQSPDALDGVLELRPYKLQAGVDHCEPDPRACGALLELTGGNGRAAPVSIR